MPGFLNADGSELVGGKSPNGTGEAFNLDAAGNLLVAQAGASNSTAYVTTGSVTNDGDTLSLAVLEADTALIQLLGTFSMTVLFEASPDSGTTWYSVSGVQGTGTIASSATVPGYWRVNVAGFTHIRVRSHPITSGTANVIIRLTSGVQNVSIANATSLGQQTSANSSSVVIASDQTVPVRGGYLEVIGNGTGVVNGMNTDLISSIDVSAYRWLSLQIQGTYSATLSFQVSNDNVNWGAVKLLLSSSYVDNNANISTNATGQIWIGPVVARYFRVRATAFTSNASLAGTLELYAIAPPLPITNPNTIATATATNIGTNDYHLVSAASTNAASIKASAGQLYGYEISNTNAAWRYVKLFNKASAPTPGTDTPWRTIGIPPGSRASFHSTTGINFTTGIAIATTTGIADADATAVGAGDLVIDIDSR